MSPETLALAKETCDICDVLSEVTEDAEWRFKIKNSKRDVALVILSEMASYNRLLTMGAIDLNVAESDLRKCINDAWEWMYHVGIMDRPTGKAN